MTCKKGRGAQLFCRGYGCLRRHRRRRKPVTMKGESCLESYRHSHDAAYSRSETSDPDQAMTLSTSSLVGCDGVSTIAGDVVPGAHWATTLRVKPGTESTYVE